MSISSKIVRTVPKCMFEILQKFRIRDNRKFKRVGLIVQQLNDDCDTDLRHSNKAQ